MALNINDTKFLEIAEIICEEGLSGLDKAIQLLLIRQCRLNAYN